MKLILEKINKKFAEKTLFTDASFTFETGKIYGLLGRNGAGKTTLFNCISKNMSLDSGQIALTDETGEAHQDYDNTEIGFIYTQPILPNFMTAVEFVQFFIDINSTRLVTQKTASDYLIAVGIQEIDHNKLLKDFSHGMKNKVQMLISVITETPVLLLDEPLTSFDVIAAHDMKKLILSLKKDTVIIFSTHILQLAQDMCDEIILLHNEKLTAVNPEMIHDKNFESEIIELLSDNYGVADKETAHE
ncbi:ABC transporter ATP-binding protein [Lactococcus hodotermopsidis]|uniref:ABC transporter ATP-binding protein n=1 Tax=Pseudolactococcus hodotermopsidis TaxID=2709157 RepID=A0A6A0BAF6_9LACT|nr:ABC transporter ATP-binding protein [Lactococcus hodotermopsidis]GFH41776.1 ABC transporter ATP-binding protein [Lactococcus hodotermopsidis]